MKAVILAGGLGTRLSEETHLKPKPMVEIGGRPILWHIMKLYSHAGINDFIVCAGYKGYMIKEYFANYFLHMSDVTFDMQINQIEYHARRAEPWRVTIIDTGEHTGTGGRLKRVSDYLGDGPFCFTYGDGVANLEITQVVQFHQSHGLSATLTAVCPPGRYGALELSSPGRVARFTEKPTGDGGSINGGFFVLDTEVISRVAGDATSFEHDVLPGLASDGQLAAFEHKGFWRPMDTLRDRNYLDELWRSNQAPWKVWS